MTPSRSAGSPSTAPRGGASKARAASERERAAADRPTATRTRRSPSLTERAYAAIEEMIVTLHLEPGTAISEAELSDRIGIGRTPIREALQRLAREHLVTILPQRGSLISEISVKKQLRLLETRREVERLIVRSAARRCTEPERERFAQLAKLFVTSSKNKDATLFLRADKEFNDLCLQAARNEFAAGAMGLMHGLARRFWYLHYRQAADMPVTAKLHANIAQAIAERNEAGAAEALDRLLDNIEAFTRATVSTDY